MGIARQGETFVCARDDLEFTGYGFVVLGSLNRADTATPKLTENAFHDGAPERTRDSLVGRDLTPPAVPC